MKQELELSTSVSNLRTSPSSEMSQDVFQVLTFPNRCNYGSADAGGRPNTLRPVFCQKTLQPFVAGSAANDGMSCCQSVQSVHVHCTLQTSISTTFISGEVTKNRGRVLNHVAELNDGQHTSKMTAASADCAAACESI
jgi:hypothetical protein